MKRNIVIPTSSARHLLFGMKPGLSKSNAIVLPTGNKEGLFHFPDGEVYLRVPGLKDVGRVTILHSGYPDPNAGLIELYMILDIIRSSTQVTEPIEITIYFSVMPYARQDNAYYDGELNAAQELIRKLLVNYRVRHIYVIDAHFAGKEWLDVSLFRNNFTNVAAFPGFLIAEALKDHPKMILMAPDAGSTRRQHIEGAKKTRLDSYNVSVDLGKRLARKVDGRTIGVVDDILSTGTTLERFYHQVKKLGAKKVYAIVTHALNQGGIDRILGIYDGLYVTNTVNLPGLVHPKLHVLELNRHIWAMIERNMS